uniref:Uncharacterized protein n=1 Tax=Oryza brachyantha TaxID=4533 RepID=A0A0U1WXG8_ORYBR|nr:hypothetical protein [Oryza brachyantha]
MASSLSSGPDALRHRGQVPQQEPVRGDSVVQIGDDDGRHGRSPEERAPSPSAREKRQRRMKRFMEYSKRALLYEFPLATALLQHRAASFTGSTWAKVGVALLCAAFFADLMGSLYLSLVTRLDDHAAEVSASSCRWHGFRIYASGVLLMSMPFCLLMSLNGLYAFLAVALAPPLYLVLLVFAKENRQPSTADDDFPAPRGERQGMRYEDYDGKLKYQFDASAAVNTIATGAGLTGTFFGYSSDYSPDHAVTVSESLLFLTIVGGQFVMLITAARPMFRKESSPARLAGFLGQLVGSLPVLLSLSAFAGAIDFLGGLALLAFSIDFLELVFFFKAMFYSELEEPSPPTTAPPPAAADAPAAGETQNELKLLWLCVMCVYFMALEALYQEQGRRKTTLEWLDRGRVLIYFWAFCCCSLDGGKGKLPLLPPLDELRKQHRFSVVLAAARYAVMVLAAFAAVCRIAGPFLAPVLRRS